jgi:hypothetical protein
MRRDRHILSMALSIGMLLASLALAQNPQAVPLPQAQQPQPNAEPPQNPYLQESENLNQMALDLRQQVEKSTKDQLSLSVIRRAEAIEKLAHSLKQRIRTEGGLQ